MERDAALGHDPRLQPALVAGEAHAPPPLPELLRNRERRENVATRAATREKRVQNRCCRRLCHRIPVHPCWARLSRPPQAQSVTTREDPPYEMDGGGIPWVGKNATGTLTLMRACMTSTPVKPQPR